MAIRSVFKDGDKEIIDGFYEHVGLLLKERGLKWADLARLIGTSPRSIISMKSQGTNPGWITAVRIARALDVSLDEIEGGGGRTRELYDLYWQIPKDYAESPEKQGAACEVFSATAYLSTHPEDAARPDRMTVTKKLIKERLERTGEDGERGYV